MAKGGERSNAGGRSDGPAGGAGHDGRAGPATLGLDALLEVQRRGLQAAGELVDRLVRTVDGPGAEPGGDAAPANGARAAGSDGRGVGGGASRDPADAGGEALDQLARAWADWVRRGLSVLDGAAGGTRPPPASPGGATDPASGAEVALAAEGAVGVARLVARPDGPPAAAPRVGTDDPPAAAPHVGRVAGSTEVWVHNRGARDRAAVALHGGPLLGSDGMTLSAGAVHVSPAVVDLPARSSRGITVAVRATAAPGTYRGVIVATGDPEAWIALEVTVTDHDGGGGDGDDGR